MPKYVHTKLIFGTPWVNVNSSDSVLPKFQEALFQLWIVGIRPTIYFHSLFNQIISHAHSKNELIFSAEHMIKMSELLKMMVLEYFVPNLNIL